MNQTTQVTSAFVEAYGIAAEKRHEFLTPEHLLAGFLKDKDFWEAISSCSHSQELEDNLYSHLNNLESVPHDHEYSLEFSVQMQETLEKAAQAASSAGGDVIHTHHIIFAIFNLEESFARFYLEEALECPIPDFLNSIMGISEEIDPEEADDRIRQKFLHAFEGDPEITGRQMEMDQAVRVLCRKTVHNVIFVGGKGVGKTSVARGIAARIRNGNVPAMLKDVEVVELDTNRLLGGTQYRGELEGRVDSLVTLLKRDGNLILYVEDLRNLTGFSKMDDGSRDILATLVPYLKSPYVRIMVSASYEDIKRLSSIDHPALAYFRQIEIAEISDTEAEKIVSRAAETLSAHFGIRYEKCTAAHSVKMSRRYIQDKCLPSKAIDLMDEAGAYAVAEKRRKVDCRMLDKVLSDICRADVQASDENTRNDLLNMEENLNGRIFGQSEAIRTLTESILISKAGLLDSNRTVGNFLFVGPTGVGKTELSKVLAEQLHIPLHRFDMSEYSEKHSVAKLIGSPAGYVGYDDGGILTDTVRKNPYCVLLLDEIEKAHEDIYNLLLQVMDYAVISDNKGRKADFRNVVLIMTSNAGARYAHKASIGFDSKTNAGAAMAKEVKKVFAPEFINRLTSVVVFNDMNEDMARLILDDKIGKLKTRLASRNINLDICPEAYGQLIKEGFSQEYGAREIERVLNSRLTPLLMKEILFGRKENFTAVVKYDGDKFIIS